MGCLTWLFGCGGDDADEQQDLRTSLLTSNAGALLPAQQDMQQHGEIDQHHQAQAILVHDNIPAATATVITTAIGAEITTLLEFLRTNSFIPDGSLDLSKINDAMTHVGQYYNPITLAAKQRNLVVCQLLHALGADINAPNAVANTALHMAVDNQHRELADWLLENGADPEAVNQWGKTPIDISTANGFELVIPVKARASSTSKLNLTIVAR